MSAPWERMGGNRIGKAMRRRIPVRNFQALESESVISRLASQIKCVGRLGSIYQLDLVYFRIFSREYCYIEVTAHFAMVDQCFFLLEHYFSFGVLEVLMNILLSSFVLELFQTSGNCMHS
jgi:hypothetical protein